MEGISSSEAFVTHMPRMACKESVCTEYLGGSGYAEQMTYDWCGQQQHASVGPYNSSGVMAWGSEVGSIDGFAPSANGTVFVPGVSGYEESKQVYGGMMAATTGEGEEEEVRAKGEEDVYPVMYICPAAANAARQSTRHLLHCLLNERSLAQPSPLVTPQQTAPLAITWHASPLQPDSISLPFVPLPHKKRTREMAELIGSGPSEGAEERAVGVLAGACRSLQCTAAKLWRVDEHDQPAAHNTTERTSAVQQSLLTTGERKREREEEAPIDSAAPQPLRQRRRV